MTPIEPRESSDLLWEVIPWYDEGYPEYPDERGTAEWVRAPDAESAKAFAEQQMRLGKVDLGSYAWLEVVPSDKAAFERQLAAERLIFGHEKSIVHDQSGQNERS